LKRMIIKQGICILALREEVRKGKVKTSAEFGCYFGC